MNLPPPVVHFIYQSQIVSTTDIANHGTSLIIFMGNVDGNTEMQNR